MNTLADTACQMQRQGSADDRSVSSVSLQQQGASCRARVGLELQ
jgi:hypothetical protein